MLLILKKLKCKLPAMQRLINTKKWDVESYDKWILEDSNAYDYEIVDTEVDK